MIERKDAVVYGTAMCGGLGELYGTRESGPAITRTFSRWGCQGARMRDLGHPMPPYLSEFLVPSIHSPPVQSFINNGPQLLSIHREESPRGINMLNDRLSVVSATPALLPRRH